jgi:shikimate dehydrogenase
MTQSPPLAGVVGWPIGHSRSPALHGYWLRKYGIDGYYVPVGIKPQDFETAILAMPKLGFRGINLTIPYKESILPLLDSVSDRAALIGAVNTVVFREAGGIYGDNTDGYGFIQNLRQSRPDWNPKAGPALVLGAGGAARAIVSALLTEGVPEIRLSNRTRQRCEIFREQFGARITIVDWNKASEGADGAATIVNTTSLGMDGKPANPVKLDAAPGTALVTDIVYTPLKTGFLRQAEELGLTTVDGLGMLLHQAVPAFEHWFDKRPEVDDALREIVLSA